MFALDSPPIPWLDLGWIEGFERCYDTPPMAVRSGNTFRFAVSRADEARVEFDFREWGKLQMALAGGSEHMNVLATSSGATPAPSGGTPVAGAAVLAGSTASELVIGKGAECVCCGKFGCSGRGLSTADRIRRLGNFGGVREQSRGGKPGFELRAEGDV